MEQVSTKKCSKCKRELSLDNFRWKNKSKGIRHSQCRDCQKESDKKFYLENESRRVTVRGIADSQKQRNILIVDELKKCGCCKCGEVRSYVLDFHHVDPTTKDDSVSHLLKTASVEHLLEELSKCIVLCANCHREWHYLSTRSNISIEDFIGHDIVWADSSVGRA